MSSIHKMPDAVKASNRTWFRRGRSNIWLVMPFLVQSLKRSQPRHCNCSSGSGFSGVRVSASSSVQIGLKSSTRVFTSSVWFSSTNRFSGGMPNRYSFEISNKDTSEMLTPERSITKVV